MAKSEKTSISIRKTVLIWVSIILAVFSVVLFVVVNFTSNRILLTAEEDYMKEQQDTISKTFDAAKQNLLNMTQDVAYWDETVLYFQNKSDDYFNINWPGTGPLQNYQFHLLIMRDTAGKAVHTEFYDFINDTDIPAPAGFEDGAVLSIAKIALDRCKSVDLNDAAAVEEIYEVGTIYHNEQPFYVCTVPVMVPGGGETPVGTVTFGYALTDAFFKEITRMPQVEFAFVQLPLFMNPTETLFEKVDDDTLCIMMPVKDYFGNTQRIDMVRGRTIYNEGRLLARWTSLILLVLALLLIAVLYIVLVFQVLRPVEAISKSLRDIPVDGLLDVSQHSQSREFYLLANSINETLERMHQSNISLDAFKRIFNAIDAHIYVSDLETNKILFINTRMAEAYGIDPTEENLICHEVFYNSEDGRCAHCPNAHLRENPDATVEWESYNPVADRYYFNTDCLIEWTDNKLAHLQYCLDVTSEKEAAQVLGQRLKQQELMSEISQSFISSQHIFTLITHALAKTGEFMDVDSIKFAVYDEKTGEMVIRNGWYNEKQGVMGESGDATALVDGKQMYETLHLKGEAALIVNDAAESREGAELDAIGVKSYMAVPLYNTGEFYGVLCFSEFRHKRVWTESNTQLARLIANVISGVVTRNETEAELFRMSSIVDASPEFIAYIDKRGNFRYINKGVVDITRYSYVDLMRDGMGLLVGEEGLRTMTETYIAQVMETGNATFEHAIRCKDGDTRSMMFSVFLTDESGEGIGLIATDLTDMRKLEADLIAAKEQAEESSRAKGDFLSRMSHEMRTPMNAIIGMSNIARASDDPARKEYCLEKIDDASKHLLGVINDILDMSKIEANKFELSYQEFEFERMLRRVTNVINFRVDEKKQDFILKLDPNLPRSIIGDDQRLAQVITNLLSNAVKFTPEGGKITLTVQLLDEDDEGLCTLRFGVHDTGIGISEEQQSRLFRSFEQADGGIARKFGGTGLGLAISKSVVDIMGGEIHVESELGEGANFVFTIQAMRGHAYDNEGQVSPSIDLQRLRVLAVDDSDDVREYFEALAEQAHFHCQTANSAKTAIEILTDPTVAPFHILFVDWKMPEMNGVELAQYIREHIDERAVIVMISSSEWSDIEPEAKHAGINRFLPKPLFSSVLINCINETLSPEIVTAGEALPEDHSYQNKFAGKRVLLAEDVEINREIVAALLEETGVALEYAENGKEALAMFKNDPARYDMIFMDIHMPEMDGYEVTKRIRALDFEKAKNIPIVAMTANVFREDIERCLAAGMNSHIGKPIDLNEMLTRMDTYLLGE